MKLQLTPKRTTSHSASSFHFPKLPVDTKVFASKLLKKLRAFSSLLSPSLRYLSNHRSIPFLSTAPAWLAGILINCSRLEGHIWRRLICPDGPDRRFSCRLRSEPPDVPEMSRHRKLGKTREILVLFSPPFYHRKTTLLKAVEKKCPVSRKRVRKGVSPFQLQTAARSVENGRAEARSKGEAKDFRRAPYNKLNDQHSGRPPPPRDQTVSFPLEAVNRPCPARREKEAKREAVFVAPYQKTNHVPAAANPSSAPAKWSPFLPEP
ncbi:hypothetical protein DAPPUDRAFT_117725 [Daphnia pulex]|uniref:Uncharacterized protein n=1 Tax=Daphnia pulex TaxID=6669 RepID=E9HTL3_DAPPU|nr:hypothetical protein DAPPUDRAFT_117725 [Daphnia pulex]|eukprot:EFX64908.1 hypothetical protein DAPPUDRAFT_117725 [Daphnia pulex]